MSIHMKTFIICPNCGRKSLTRFGMIIKAKSIYQFDYDSWQYRPRFMTKYSYPELRTLLKRKDILGSYCKYCEKPYPKELNQELLESLKKRLVLADLMRN